MSRNDATHPAALVITAAGINCDVELAHAFELAGARAHSIHLNRLQRDPEVIEQFDLIGIPGGFSFGDAIAAGRIAAALMRQSLWGALTSAVRRGVPIIAPCNGFQIAVQVGLLPGPRSAGDDWPAQPPAASVALSSNAGARFVDRWCRVAIPPASRCIWTRNLQPSPEAALLPIAHGEGRFITGSDAAARLDAAGQVALRYHADDNPNGSLADVAGICDASGLVFGLMPHPERFTHWTQHPWWTRLNRATLEGQEPLGLQMFRNAVDFVRRDRVDASQHAERAAPAHSL